MSAWLSEQRVLELYPTSKLPSFTNNTIDTSDKLIKELISTKERRYAIDLGEYSPGIRCIASPILGFNNTCVAAISISMLENHSQDKVDELAQGQIGRASCREREE